MSEKWGQTKSAKRRTPHEARVTWPRLNCLNPNLGRIIGSPTAMLINDGASHSTIPPGWIVLARWDGFLTMSQGVEMSGGPNSRFSTTSRKHEIAYGARALWRRSHRSSPRTGKPSTWRRVAGQRKEKDKEGVMPSTKSQYFRRLESRVLGNLQARFGGG
jgi:hypothetical protein